MSWFARLVLMVLLVAAATGSWHFYNDGWLQFGGGDKSAEKPAPEVPATEAHPNAPVTAHSADAAADEARAPAFDIVRVGDSGDMIIAGVAPAGWTVRVMAQGRIIGETAAGADGSWMVMPEAPLRAGDHSLSLMAEAPDAVRSLWGRERVAVSLAPDGAPAVVALSQDNEPTRLLQAGPMPDRARSDANASGPSVAFSAVDYEDEGQTGRLYISGAAQPGARVALYLDNRFIGSAKADAEGAWEFGLTDIIEAGTQALRADHIDMNSGKVLSRAEVQFNPRGLAVASAEGGETRTAMTDIAGERRLRNQLPEGERSASASSDQIATGGRLAQGQAVIVRRGDTLWHIAEAHYGSGMRYTKIFRGNRDQIRNPHLIYPGQQFDLPN